MSVGVLWLLGIGVMAAIGGAVHYFSEESRIKRTLRAARPWPIAELPEDTLGRVIGRAAQLDGVLTAPITGRTCVFYVVEVLEKRGKSHATLIREETGVPFVLTDDSGRAIVDPTGAKLALTTDASTTSGSLDDATPVEEAFLARHGKSSRGWVFNKVLTYREAIVEVGERVAILGAGVREPDPDAGPGEGYRGGPPTRLRLTSSSRYPLLISDDLSVSTER